MCEPCRPNTWTCPRCGVTLDGLLDACGEPRPPWGWSESPGPDARVATCRGCRAAHDPDPGIDQDVASVEDGATWFG